jgi:hypothetical protein
LYVKLPLGFKRLKKWGGRQGTGFIWLRITTSDGLFWLPHRTSGFHERGEYEKRSDYYAVRID